MNFYRFYTSARLCYLTPWTASFVLVISFSSCLTHQCNLALQNLSFILDTGLSFRQEWLLGVWLESDTASVTYSPVMLDGYIRSTKNGSTPPSSLFSIPSGPLSNHRARFCDSYFPFHKSYIKIPYMIISFLRMRGRIDKREWGS